MRKRFWMRSRTALWSVVCAGVGLLACSSSSRDTPPDATAGAGDDASVECAMDPLVTTPLGPKSAAALPMTTAGEGGKLSFVLVDPMMPNPPSQETNSWTVKVVDATGAPVKDAMLTFPNPKAAGANPWMPYMKHGSIPAQATNNGDGTYTISLFFNMQGVWQLKVQAQSGSATDSVTYGFCVE